MGSSPHPEPADLLAEARDGYEGLVPLPGRLVETRHALHAVAENVLAPARKAATGNEIALRWYPGGVGTPEFVDDRGQRVIRTDLTDLVDACDGGERRQPFTSLRDTGKLVGDIVDSHELSEEPLAVDAKAAAFLDGWFRFGTLVIAELQTNAAEDLDPGLVQLWPEHFDVATELGSEKAGQRAAFGASPGDDEHETPYLYVAPWSGEADGEPWNATAFSGAELGCTELLESDDPVQAARDFFDRCLEALTA
jgi:hypothetical protein